MNLFINPLLASEASDIHNNNLPDHETTVSMIIHTELKDYYPSNVVGMDVVRDYTNSLTDVLHISLVMGLGEYNSVIQNNRDRLQITVVVYHNGKEYKNRYKAIVLSDPMNKMINTNSAYSDDYKDKFSITEISFECIPLEYALLKNHTSHGCLSSVRLDNIIKHYLSSGLDGLVIDSSKVDYSLDIVDIHNDRLYNNIMISDKIALLDIPTELQRKYGVYNGGMGTYLYKNEDSNLVATTYPLYNTDATTSKRRLSVYIPDEIGASKSINKTCIVDGDNLKVLVQSNYSTSGRTDELSDYDYGGGIATDNSNQIMDRTITKNGEIVTNSSANNIDSIKNNSNNDMTSIKRIDTTDNLYVVRSVMLESKSYLYSFQWNYSRPDYLIPGMGVDVIFNREGKIIRLKGVLISSHSRYDNNQKICTSRLNVVINR